MIPQPDHQCRDGRATAQEDYIWITPHTICYFRSPSKSFGVEGDRGRHSVSAVRMGAEYCTISITHTWSPSWKSPCPTRISRRYLYWMEMGQFGQLLHKTEIPLEKTFVIECVIPKGWAPVTHISGSHRICGSHKPWNGFACEVHVLVLSLWEVVVRCHVKGDLFGARNSIRLLVHLFGNLAV